MLISQEVRDLIDGVQVFEITEYQQAIENDLQPAPHDLLGVKLYVRYIETKISDREVALIEAIDDDTPEDPLLFLIGDTIGSWQAEIDGDSFILTTGTESFTFAAA